MPNSTEIYQNSIKQMPSFERLRLATLILEDLTAEQVASRANYKLSAFELLENLNGERIFQTPDEVDQHLKTERESWER